MDSLCKFSSKYCDIFPNFLLYLFQRLETDSIFSVNVYIYSMVVFIPILQIILIIALSMVSIRQIFLIWNRFVRKHKKENCYVKVGIKLDGEN